MSNPFNQKGKAQFGFALFLFVTIFCLSDTLRAQTAADSYVSAKPSASAFRLSANGQSAPLCVSETDYKGVIRALTDLQTDIAAVTSAQPELITGALKSKQVVLVGTIGKSTLIDGLIKNKKLNVTGIAGKWETFVTQIIENPLPGVKRALVIAGSDKRGTIYGIYDLSQQIGVSPWYWWADVPVKTQAALYVKPGRHSNGTPAVKYRGIFINDEAPAFSGWTKEKFGGVNHNMYVKMFELILRLKGNYLWPAMWGNAFNDDDKLNPVLADEYGIVMGTSHHEPMDRAQQEWKRYGKGPWNYATNGQVLRDFWKKGIENMGSKETVVTVGMRGDGDMPMAEGGAKENVKLLENIVKDQRDIIAQTTGRDITKVPQMWALYKEVQDYYDIGMRVPDDITLLLCDDNWGNVRRLPKISDPKRAGGYGIYYHFDYVGGPRNYKWLNTNPLPHTWQQMNLAYEYGARQIWIVNVGDLKPMEFPISFFLDYAWNPNKWPANSLQNYTQQWAQKQFGPQYAAQIADIISKYTKYNGRRKPEMVDASTYSLTNYSEFETVVADYNRLNDEVEQLKLKIPAAYQDAYYQLVLHPVQACANYNALYLAAAKNKWYAQQGRAAANDEAQKVNELFTKDAEISKYYNTVLAGGKWSHMMDQSHIGYTSWQEPRGGNKAPAVTKLDLPATADMGVAIEGSAAWWPNQSAAAILPEFTPYPKTTHYIEIFNRGQAAFNFTAQSAQSWVKVLPQNGTIDKQQRLLISVDWDSAPKGSNQVPVTITGANGAKVVVQAIVKNGNPVPLSGFVQSNGYIAMEAIHYNRAVNTAAIKWTVLPDYGRTLSAVTVMPVTAKRQVPGSGPHLEYDINLADTGSIKVTAYVAPSIDFTHGEGLYYSISIDDETPQKINIDPLIDDPRRANAVMETASANLIKQLTSTHRINKPGKHVLKFWMVDPAVVLEKIVIDAGGVKPSFLGPPESYRVERDK